MVTDLQLEDKYDIVCKISDGDEKAETKAKLAITQMKVEMLQALQDKEVPQGEPVSFTVQLDKPDVDHKWIVDGKVATAGPSAEMKKKGNTYEMILKKPRAGKTAISFEANRGAVKTACDLKVTTTAGFGEEMEPEYHWEENAKLETLAVQVDSPQTEVTWWFRPAMFVNELETRELSQGQDGTLYCDCNFPDLNVIWDKDGEIINDGGRYKMGQDEFRRTLTIKNVQPGDAGKYSARLDNGTKTTADVKVVATAAQPYTPPEKYRGTVEDYELDNSWKKLVDTDRLSINAAGLKREIEVRDVCVSDAGEYCCKTDDVKTFGRVRIDAFSITKGLQDCEVGEKESAEFFIQLSKPTRKITWFLKGEKLTDGGDVVLRNDGKVATLIMDNCTMDQAGTVRVEAESVSSKAQLGVTRDLKFTSKLEDVYATEKEDAVFEITVSSVEAKVQWFRGKLF